jgi:hypothetical protein
MEVLELDVKQLFQKELANCKWGGTVYVHNGKIIGIAGFKHFSRFGFQWISEAKRRK